MGLKKLIAIVAAWAIFSLNSCSAIPNYVNANKNRAEITADQNYCENQAGEYSEWNKRWANAEVMTGKIIATIILPIMIPFWFHAADGNAKIYQNHYEGCMIHKGYKVAKPEK